MDDNHNFSKANVLVKKAINDAIQTFCPYCLDPENCYETDKHKYIEQNSPMQEDRIISYICHCDGCGKDFVTKQQRQFVPIAIEPIPENISDFESW